MADSHQKGALQLVQANNDPSVVDSKNQKSFVKANWVGN
jgi:hypothetical protein